MWTYGASRLFDDCPCPALDDTYVDPATDPAPWYDADHAESASFLGFLPQTVNLSVPASRSLTDTFDLGSVVGPEKLPGRVVEVVGWMIAEDAPGMYWGERWLTEALRGTMCKGNCRGDELDLLAFCRDDCPDDDPDCENDFRRMVGAATVDGPRFSEVSGDACFIIGQAQFQFAPAMPYLYQPTVTHLGDAFLAAGDTGCVLVETGTWMDGEALVIDINASEEAAVSDITMTLTFSLDGTCPEDRVLPSITYNIASIVRSGGITIDAMRREVSFHNPTAKRDEPGFRYIDWGDGPFCWPVLPPCASVCVCIHNGGSETVGWTVQGAGREL